MFSLLRRPRSTSPTEGIRLCAFSALEFLDGRSSGSSKICGCVVEGMLMLHTMLLSLQVRDAAIRRLGLGICTRAYTVHRTRRCEWTWLWRSLCIEQLDWERAGRRHGNVSRKVQPGSLHHRYVYRTSRPLVTSKVKYTELIEVSAFIKVCFLGGKVQYSSRRSSSLPTATTLRSF
jgi:hypothetical protein